MSLRKELAVANISIKLIHIEKKIGNVNQFDLQSFKKTKIMMKKINSIIIALTVAVIAVSWSSCQKMSMTQGNGHVVTEKRQLVSFDEIINESSYDVKIIQDSIWEARVEAESNLIPYIRTIVNGNTLIIDTRNGGLQSTFPITRVIRVGPYGCQQYFY